MHASVPWKAEPEIPEQQRSIELDQYCMEFPCDRRLRGYTPLICVVQEQAESYFGTEPRHCKTERTYHIISDTLSDLQDKRHLTNAGL